MQYPIKLELVSFFSVLGGSGHFYMVAVSKTRGLKLGLLETRPIRGSLATRATSQPHLLLRHSSKETMNPMKKFS